MAGGVTCAIKNYKALKKRIDKTSKTSETVTKRILSDFKSRAPTWIAKEVSEVYGITKKEVNTLGNMKVKGDSIDEVAVVYKGRVLTPTHFKMSPTAPKPAYTLKAEIIRGKKATLGKVKKLTKKQRKALAKNFTGEGTRKSDHSPIMLLKTGAASADKTQYIPFQRKSVDRNDLKAIKSVSVPQMVRNEKAQPRITRAINEGMEKRIQHHMKLLNKQ